MKKKWQIMKPDTKTARGLCEALQCHPVTATVLVNRGLVNAEVVKSFFNISLKNLRPPFSIKDMDKAVLRIHDALKKNEKILIFGDYDADGITATVLLFEFLQAANARVDYYVPHRLTEGYGLRESHVRDLIKPKQYNLLITVDCGIGSHEAVAAAGRAGIDVIITDHHQVPETLPEALAVINPKRIDCDAGFTPLAGVGVVYALLICLRKHLRGHGFWDLIPEPNLKNACDLVALGTVADIVPLLFENRILTKLGIEALNSGQRPGIQVLLEKAGVKGNLTSAEDIAFRLAPRINAAGRIGHANLAIELLTTRDYEKAESIADTLNGLNADRRAIENSMLKQSLERLAAIPDLNRKPAIVLSDPNWHEGVLGIVAARLVERYYRPVVLISTQNGIGRGSARSIPGFNLHDGLQQIGSCLLGFGGHAAAAGLSIVKENINRFATLFETVVKNNTSPEAFIPVITIDQELSFDQLSPRLADELEQLQPFGEGNPEPLFSAKDVMVSYSQMIGGTHRRMRLLQSGSKPSQALHAIQFNVHPAYSEAENFDRIAFRLRWNRWNGEKTLQLLIEAVE